MTIRQQKFADEYLINPNATRAYRAAYPNIKSDDVAQKNGSRLLANPEVKEYIDQRLEEISGEKIANAQEVMEYLTAVLRGAAESEIVVMVGMGEGTSQPLRMMKRPDENQKLKAAALLAKRYGMDRVQVEGLQPVYIIDDLGD